jgi:hypothetical protein
MKIFGIERTRFVVGGCDEQCQKLYCYLVIVRREGWAIITECQWKGLLFAENVISGSEHIQLNRAILMAG